ncbi:hypothetical protein [Varunaivibrio sulfuroxidans]|nr:hypothetical protein [Varunaivibrio sulfuroxidans]WES30655.1 hypothetical protein P3M64_13610 [Varunaivibrio sulfuroxidans]
MKRKMHLPSHVTDLSVGQNTPTSATTDQEMAPRLPAEQDVARMLIAMHKHGLALRKCVMLHLNEVGKYVLLDQARKELGYPQAWPIVRTTEIDRRYRELLAFSDLNTP